jgi:hypothetical protein
MDVALADVRDQVENQPALGATGDSVTMGWGASVGEAMLAGAGPAVGAEGAAMAVGGFMNGAGSTEAVDAMDAAFETAGAAASTGMTGERLHQDDLDELIATGGACILSITGEAVRHKPDVS